MKDSPDLATLNVVHQVLKGLTLAFVLERKANPAVMASALQGAAMNSPIDETAKAILLDIAEGLDILAQGISGHG